MEKINMIVIEFVNIFLSRLVTNFDINKINTPIIVIDF